MFRVLVVDDEKIEREGIKFLLSKESGEHEILEARDGRQALGILKTSPVDLLLTDIKMPHMDGLELSKRAREAKPDLRIVIFSGYSDFSFAQEAIRYGVTDYVLKPVDPGRFHETIQKAEGEVTAMRNKQAQEEKEKTFLTQYFLQNYLYSGKEEVLERAAGMVDLSQWDKWHCVVMVETSQSFFETSEEEFTSLIFGELRRKFFFLNLNIRQSLLFFEDVYCDYALIAKHIYVILKQRYTARFYLAVSRKFEGHTELPRILSELEQQMEEKFYHPEEHVFLNEDEETVPVSEETQDSQLMQKISGDISRKDVDALWRHFNCLSEKYQKNTQFSAMYVKFVFSNVIQELFQENRFSEERRLDREIDKLYGCSSITQILEITRGTIREYQEFLERSMNESRGEVATVKNYIYQHYAEDLSLETLAEKVYLSSGYLSFIFKKETGMNLNRFIRVVRMEKAKELLSTTNRKVAQVGEAVGFTNVSYFCRSFREYYGSSPESWRKGTGENEENTGEIPAEHS